MRSYYVDYYQSEMNNGGFSQFVYNSRWSPTLVSLVRKGLSACTRLRICTSLPRTLRTLSAWGNRLHAFLQSEYFGANLERDRLDACGDRFAELAEART